MKKPNFKTLYLKYIVVKKQKLLIASGIGLFSVLLIISIIAVNISKQSSLDQNSGVNLTPTNFQKHIIIPTQSQFESAISELVNKNVYTVQVNETKNGLLQKKYLLTISDNNYLININKDNNDPDYYFYKGRFYNKSGEDFDPAIDFGQNEDPFRYFIGNVLPRNFKYNSYKADLFDKGNFQTDNVGLLGDFNLFDIDSISNENNYNDYKILVETTGDPKCTDFKKINIFQKFQLIPDLNCEYKWWIFNSNWELTTFSSWKNDTNGGVYTEARYDFNPNINNIIEKFLNLDLTYGWCLGNKFSKLNTVQLTLKCPVDMNIVQRSDHNTPNTRVFIGYGDPDYYSFQGGALIIYKKKEGLEIDWNKYSSIECLGAPCYGTWKIDKLNTNRKVNVLGAEYTYNLFYEIAMPQMYSCDLPGVENMCNPSLYYLYTINTYDYEFVIKIQEEYSFSDYKNKKKIKSPTDEKLLLENFEKIISSLEKTK